VSLSWTCPSDVEGILVTRSKRPRAGGRRDASTSYYSVCGQGVWCPCPVAAMLSGGGMMAAVECKRHLADRGHAGWDA
jgi:hypothetical protein